MKNIVGFLVTGYFSSPQRDQGCPGYQDYCTGRKISPNLFSVSFSSVKELQDLRSRFFFCVILFSLYWLSKCTLTLSTALFLLSHSVFIVYMSSSI